MCGFVGFTGLREQREAILHKMADRIIHRGPDMEGYHISGDGPRTAIALGFRRLSIIDLAAGKQPMYNEDGTVVCVFNGEIYNFMDLRTELQAKGHIFKTHCDTEVIIHGYEEYGTSLAAKLRGMFAFVVWDTKTNEMYGARDIFGIKPFYYTQTDAGELLFGSEIKSLLEHPGFRREVNAEALRPYLTFQYSAMNETFFKGTYKLPPAHWFTYKDGRMQIERYWDADFRHPTTLSYEQCADQIDARVRESVAAHRISDVKVGSFLSGGVDSSYITACLMPDETFSVGFASPDGTHKFDETTEAGELSQKLGIKNYREMLTKEQCLDAFADIQYHMDEPQSNPSSVPLYFLCQLARQHVTVVLSGEGADEIYAGYEWYADTPLMQKYKHVPAPLRHLASDVSQHLPYFNVARGGVLPALRIAGAVDVVCVRHAEFGGAAVHAVNEILLAPGNVFGQRDGGVVCRRHDGRAQQVFQRIDGVCVEQGLRTLHCRRTRTDLHAVRQRDFVPVERLQHQQRRHQLRDGRDFPALVGVLLENHCAGRRFRQNRGWGRERHRRAGFQGLCRLRRRQENHQHTACQRPKPFACLHCLFLL